MLTSISCSQRQSCECIEDVQGICQADAAEPGVLSKTERRLYLGIRGFGRERELWLPFSHQSAVFSTWKTCVFKVRCLSTDFVVEHTCGKVNKGSQGVFFFQLLGLGFFQLLRP
jgi:hypothetical protein